MGDTTPEAQLAELQRVVRTQRDATSTLEQRIEHLGQQAALSETQMAQLRDVARTASAAATQAAAAAQAAATAQAAAAAHRAAIEGHQGAGGSHGGPPGGPGGPGGGPGGPGDPHGPGGPAPPNQPAGGPGAMPRGYKPESLPKFLGKTGEDVEAWLFQVEEAQLLFPILDEEQRIRHVSLALRDTAARWYSAMQMGDDPQLTTWDQFVLRLREQFVHLDQKWIARNQIHTFVQSGTVRDYTVKFRSLMLLIPDMSKADALDRYIRGLKDWTWKVWRRKFDTIEQAMIYAEELDLEAQQKLVLMRKSHKHAAVSSSSKQSFPLALRTTAWQPRGGNRGHGNHAPRGESTPMELGVLRMNETERERHIAQDLCFNCHKPGHRSNVCPTKDRSTKEGSGNGVRRR